MIRTLLIASTFAAVAGAANAYDLANAIAFRAPEVKVSVIGKDDATVRLELGQAAKAVCKDVDVSDYAPCLSETYSRALSQAVKIKASYK